MLGAVDVGPQVDHLHVCLFQSQSPLVALPDGGGRRRVGGARGPCKGIMYQHMGALVRVFDDLAQSPTDPA